MGSECQSFDLHRREESNGETGKEAWTRRSKQASNQAMQKYGLSLLVLCWGMDNTGGFWYVGRRLKSLQHLYTSLKFFLQTKKTSQFLWVTHVKTEQTLPVPFAPRPATVVLWPRLRACRPTGTGWCNWHLGIAPSWRVEKLMLASVVLSQQWIDPFWVGPLLMQLWFAQAGQKLQDTTKGIQSCVLELLHGIPGLAHLKMLGLEDPCVWVGDECWTPNSVMYGAQMCTAQKHKFVIQTLTEDEGHQQRSGSLRFPGRLFLWFFCVKVHWKLWWAFLQMDLFTAYGQMNKPANILQTYSIYNVMCTALFNMVKHCWMSI